MKTPFYFTLIVLLISANYSCSLIDPASPSASYLKIDSFNLSADYPTQGSRSSKITDVWVLYDGVYFGTFPLPAVIPLPLEGVHALSIKPGILRNGIAASRSAYPKYSSLDTSINLIARDTISIRPSITYASGLTFPQLEDFDDASLSLVSTTSGQAPILITPAADPNAFEGNSGVVTLDSLHTVFDVASSSAFYLPLNTPTYLELNYKCETDFTIGVFITTQSGVYKNELLSVRSSSVWKKIYVTLSELGGVESDGIDYKIYLHAVKSSTVTTANLYFDNLKVVY